MFLFRGERELEKGVGEGGSFRPSPHASNRAWLGRFWSRKTTQTRRRLWIHDKAEHAEPERHTAGRIWLELGYWNLSFMLFPLFCPCFVPSFLLLFLSSFFFVHLFWWSINNLSHFLHKHSILTPYYAFVCFFSLLAVYYIAFSVC